MPRITNDDEQCPDQLDGFTHVWETADRPRIVCSYCGVERTSRFVAPDTSKQESWKMKGKRK